MQDVRQKKFKLTARKNSGRPSEIQHSAQDQNNVATALTETHYPLYPS